MESLKAFNAKRIAISKESIYAPLSWEYYLFGLIILVLHVLCIVFEVPKLNETIYTYVPSNGSEEWKMEQKRKDEENTKNKKNYTISIIAISSIMIFLILVGAVNAKFFHSNSSGVVYGVLVFIGIVCLIIIGGLAYHKFNTYPNQKKL
jgi:amino acid transporter